MDHIPRLASRQLHRPSRHAENTGLARGQPRTRHPACSHRFRRRHRGGLRSRPLSRGYPSPPCALLGPPPLLWIFLILLAAANRSELLFDGSLPLRRGKPLASRTVREHRLRSAALAQSGPLTINLICRLFPYLRFLRPAHLLPLDLWLGNLR